MTKIADQTLPVNDPEQSYECETPTYLDDPYEGELFTYFIHLFSKLSKEEKEKLWEVKRDKLVSVEYEMGGVGPITVEQGTVVNLSFFEPKLTVTRLLVLLARAMEGLGAPIL